MQEIIRFISYHPVLSVTWISFLVALLFNTFKELTLKVKIVTHCEATCLINKEDAVVVDLRHYNDFQRGHITGALNLQFTKIKANNISELEKHKTKPIIVVDDVGMQQAKEIVNILFKSGFKKACILKEGISGWNDRNLPLVRSK